MRIKLWIVWDADARFVAVCRYSGDAEKVVALYPGGSVQCVDSPRPALQEIMDSPRVEQAPAH